MELFRGGQRLLCRVPTKIRIQSATAFQNITARGNDRQDIFHDTKDRLFYLDLMEMAIREYAFEVVAYCLMTNHIHMLARFAGLNMDKAMHMIQFKYAKYFNRKYDRSGHLFERRYDNKIVANEVYLHEAARYTHTNPLVEKMVSRPEDYLWSSFREYWDEEYRFVSKDSPIVSCFKPNGTFERQAFHDFTTARLRAAADPSWYQKAVYTPTPPAGDPLLQEAADRNHPVVKRIVSAVCYGFGFWDDLYLATNKSRARDDARTLTLYLLKEALPAWTFARLMPLAGLHDRKNAYRIYQKCEARLGLDPVFRGVANDVRAMLKGAVV